MNIIGHRLHAANGTAFAFKETPNMGGALKPRWLVMHYTAGGSASESINWLRNPAAKASAHLVIARDGTVTQLVPFNRVAWHAGVSEWKGVSGLNQHSIGIEMDNPGYLGRVKTFGSWRFGNRRVGDPFVLVTAHKSGAPQGGWHTYTDVQMMVAAEVARLLVRTYGLEDVIGHDDIAPGRKQDPGPAFAMEVFRKSVMQAGGSLYRTTSILNVRTGPGTTYPKAIAPIPKGTFLREVPSVTPQRPWVRVSFLDSGPVGWVHSAYLERV